MGLDIGTNEVDLNGGSITLAGTELDAVLGFSPLPSDSGHRVNWARPTLVSAATSGDGRRLFLTLSEDLNPGSRPLTSSFTVKRDGATVALRGTTATVSGRAVTLWLAAALTSATQAVTVSYADPSSADDANALQDREGNDALSFSERTVTNRFGPNKVFTGSALIPEGLGVGDSFRLLFLTSTTRDARSSDIDDYNAFVQAAAAGGDAAIQEFSDGFLAVASTGAVDARDNTATTGTGVAIYWFGGNKIADNYADFYDGTWDDETNATDESGSAYDDGGAVVFVWTGTDDDGTVLVNPSNIGGGPRGLGVSGAGAAVGFVNSRNDPTMDASRPNPLNSGGVNATNKLFNLYALSEVFLVVDPAAITGVEITSDPGHDQSYATGDEIELALRFGRAVEVSGQPRIKLRLGETESTERWAEHEGGVLVKNTAQIPFSGRALNASSPRLAQQFTTAGGIVDYTLRSIGVRFHTIDNLATAAGQLRVRLHADDNGNPGAALCTLDDPASFGSNALNTFGAPDTCPALAPGTAYFVVIERVGFSAADTIALWDTAGAGEDGGSAAGWSIRNSGHAFMPSRQSWNAAVAPLLIKVSGGLTDPDYSTRTKVLINNTGQTIQGTFNLTGGQSVQASQFTTGGSRLGYRLTSIGFAFGTITDPSTAGDAIRITLRADQGYPGYELCTFSPPSSFTSGVTETLLVDGNVISTITTAVNRFSASTCPALAPNTDYFVVFERLIFDAGEEIEFVTTGSRSYDAVEAGWSFFDIIFAYGPENDYERWDQTEFRTTFLMEISGRASSPDEQPERPQPPAQPTLQVANTRQTGLVSSALTSTQTKHAQAFTTGGSAGGYRLDSVGVGFGAVNDPSDAPIDVVVTLHEGGGADPGAVLCTMFDPSNVFANAVSTFDYYGNCPTLTPNTTYFFVVERDAFTTGTIETAAYTSDNEDAKQPGWSIADASRLFSTTSSDWSGSSASLAIEVRAVVLPAPAFELGPVEPQVKNTGQTLGTSGNPLVANAPRWAQAITTGANEHGYKLSSIGVVFLISTTDRQPATNWPSR